MKTFMNIPYEKNFSKIIPLFLVLLGVTLMLRAYIANRPLWGDEIALIIDILNNSFWGLTKPFANSQVAPTGFLFLQKSMVLLFGNRDYVFKLIPLLSGIAGVPLMYKVARQYLQKELAFFFALGLFVVSGSIVWYATEAKPYISDVTITLLLLWAGYECTQENASVKSFIILGVAGVLAPWFSYPAIFVIAAIGMGLGLSFMVDRDWKKLLWLMSALFLSVINFAFIYFFFLRSRSADSYLLSSWRSSFMPMPPWQNPQWFYQMLLLWIQNPVGFSGSAIVVASIFLVIGCISMFLRRWQLAIFLILPLFITMLASGFQKYPFANRLLLFTLPSAYILVAEGLERFRTVFLAVHQSKIVNIRVGNFVYVFFVLWLISFPVSGAIHEFISPGRGEDITASMAYIRQHWMKSDKIYVYYGAAGPFQYYASSYGFTNSDYKIGIKSRQDPQKYIQDVRALRGNPRVWFIFSHFCNTCSGMVDEKRFFLTFLYRMGKKLDDYQVSGGAVYLYDLSYNNP
jgi:hypothetical protein